MTGTSFKQGYTCYLCQIERNKLRKEEALYRRTPEGFKFIGKVLCRKHGIQDAVKLTEVK